MQLQLDLFGLFLSSFYNFFVSITKKKAFSRKVDLPYKKYAEIGILIIITSMCYIIYSITVMNLHITSYYNKYIAITIATVTFTDITLATIGIVKSKKKNDVRTEMIKYINLATALISLSLTQTAILSFTTNYQDMSKWNGIGGIFMGGLVCLIGAYMLVNGTIKMVNAKLLNE